MTSRLTSLVTKDQTRLCFDPWGFAQIRAKGDVLPCCLRPSIGNISKKMSLKAILHGDEARAIRSSLLSGNLDSHCGSCHNRTTIPVADFRIAHSRKFFLKDKSLDAEGCVDLDAHPELRALVEFENVQPNHYGLKDRVFLHPGAGKKRPSVRFKKLMVRESSSLDLFLFVDHEQCRGLKFHVAFMRRTRLGFERCHSSHSRVVAGKGHYRWTIPCPVIGKEFEIVFSVSATGFDYAWFHFSYPFFIPAKMGQYPAGQ